MAEPLPPHLEVPHSPEPGRRTGFARALGNYNYRLFFLGQAASLIGTWMTRMASGWLVYRLATENAEWELGLVSFSGLIPIFFLAPFAGVFVDRWNRHRTLVVTQFLSLLQSIALAVVAFLGKPGEDTIWLIIGLNLFQGIVNAFDMPARQSLLIQMIDDRRDLPNAIALNSSLVNGSRLLGPAISAAIIASVGEGWCFVIDALTYVAVLAALLAMRLSNQEREPVGGSIARSLAVGVKYAVGFSPIRSLLLLIGTVSFAVMPQSVLLPVFADQILKGGPHMMGFLSSASGLGALCGALYLASRTTVIGLGKVIVIANMLLGIGLICYAFSDVPWLSGLLLIAVGGGTIVQMAAANTLIQTLVDEDKRGRVMSFFGMAFQGTAPFGSLLGGWLTLRLPPGTVVAGSGAVVLIAGLIFALRLPKLRAHARPVLIQRGVLPPESQGMNATSELPPTSPG